MKDFFVTRMQAGTLAASVLFFSSLLYAVAMANMAQIHRGNAAAMLVSIAAITIPYFVAIVAYGIRQIESSMKKPKG